MKPIMLPVGDYALLNAAHVVSARWEYEFLHVNLSDGRAYTLHADEARAFWALLQPMAQPAATAGTTTPPPLIPADVGAAYQAALRAVADTVAKTAFGGAGQ
jgi:hypothetical protein